MGLTVLAEISNNSYWLYDAMMITTPMIQVVRKSENDSKLDEFFISFTQSA